MAQEQSTSAGPPSENTSGASPTPPQNPPPPKSNDPEKSAFGNAGEEVPLWVRLQTASLCVLALGTIVAGLIHFARVLQPLFVAIFAFNVISPIATFLERRFRVSQGLTYLALVALLVLAVIGTTQLIVVNLAAFAKASPLYQERLATLAETFAEWTGQKRPPPDSEESPSQKPNSQQSELQQTGTQQKNSQKIGLRQSDQQDRPQEGGSQQASSPQGGSQPSPAQTLASSTGQQPVPRPPNSPAGDSPGQSNPLEPTRATATTPQFATTSSGPVEGPMSVEPGASVDSSLQTSNRPVSNSQASTQSTPNKEGESDDFTDRVPFPTPRLDQVAESLQEGQRRLRLPIRDAREPVEPSWSNPDLRDLLDVKPKEIVASIVGSVLQLGEGTLMCLFYLLFIVLGSRRIPNRVVAALTPETAAHVLNVGHHVSESIKQYMLVKTFVSFGMGVTTGLAMWLVGVSYWPLWAFFFFALNYITYIGSIVALIPPVAVGLVSFESPWAVIPIAVLLTLIRFFWIDYVEIHLSGQRLNISSVLVLLSLAFWGAIWGLVGLILAVPMLTTVKITLWNFKSTRKYAILISEE